MSKETSPQPEMIPQRLAPQKIQKILEAYPGVTLDSDAIESAQHFIVETKDAGGNAVKRYIPAWEMIPHEDGKARSPEESIEKALEQK